MTSLFTEALHRMLRGRGVVPPPRSWFENPDFVEPAAGEVHVALRYLGTAGFVVEGTRTLVLDPFVSRRSLEATLLTRLTCDDALGERLIPRADDVLIGHAHFDHILDAPSICRRTGARLLGSSTTANVGRAAGLPESQIVTLRGGERVASGDWTVVPVTSIHGKAAFGRVPLPGHLTSPPPWPPRAHELPHGDVFNWVIDTGHLRIGHVDSADFLPERLRGHSVDVLCLCAIGRAYRPSYTQEVIDLLRPRWVVPCHWDTMVTPVTGQPRLLPGVDLPGFVREIRGALAMPVLVPMLGTLRFPALR